MVDMALSRQTGGGRSIDLQQAAHGAVCRGRGNREQPN